MLSIRDVLKENFIYCLILRSVNIVLLTVFYLTWLDFQSEFFRLELISQK